MFAVWFLQYLINFCIVIIILLLFDGKKECNQKVEKTKSSLLSGVCPCGMNHCSLKVQNADHQDHTILLLCAWICKKNRLILNTWGYSKKKKKEKISQNKKSYEKPLVYQAQLNMWWCGKVLNLLSEIIIMSLLIVTVLNILHGIRIHRISGNTHACFLFVFLKSTPISVRSFFQIQVNFILKRFW